MSDETINGMVETIEQLENELENYKWADEIVSCKDCINNKRNVDGTAEDWCLHFGYDIDEDDFCSYGDRKESEEEIVQCEDLINRQDAIKAFTLSSNGERIPFVDCDNFPVEFPLRYIVDTIADLPPADRPTGKWYIREYDLFTCDQCGEDVRNGAECTQEAREMLKNGDFPNYCHNCGAKMESEEE